MAQARFNARILNLEADDSSRCAKTAKLRAAGFEVSEASTGVQALSVAWSWHPDLIVTNMRLPDIAASELCRRLKEDPQTASIMVLEISDRDCAPDDRITALEMGADVLLPEPVDTDELVATINRLVKIRWLQEQLRGRVDELETQLRVFQRNVQSIGTKAREMSGSQAQRRFPPNTAEELTTPLTSIITWACALRTGNYDRELVMDGLEEIERQARHELQLLKKLMHRDPRRPPHDS